MEGKCPVCDSKATHKCSQCYLMYYCSKEHQKAHWKSHKSNCKPVIVKEDKLLGRHLIASRNIKEGQIVIKEKPLVAGPSQITSPVCMGCCKNVTEATSVPCARCGWPVCDEHCQKSPHHIPECDLTVARGNKIHIKTFGIAHPNYQCITVLRCLYQKRARPEIWSKLMALESHCDQRRGTEKWKNDRIQIAQFIRSFFKLENDFSEEEIMKVCGIVQVNGHEVPLTEPPFVAIYDVTSMAEHNCRANCNKSFSSRGEVLVVAAADIPAGANISICYTDPLWGTSNRRHHLIETKFFQCSCERCSDVTEFGTMFSALRCQKVNCQGHVLPKTFLTNDEDFLNRIENIDIKKSENGIRETKEKDINDVINEESKKDGSKATDQIEDKQKDNNLEINGNYNNNEKPIRADSKGNETEGETTDWFCNVCGKSVTELYVYKLMDHVGKDLNAMEKGSCDSCLRFLEHYGKFLHPNHYYMIDVSLAMGQLIGQEGRDGLHSVSEERLALKTDTCRRMVNFLEKLVPAEVRARGGVMFELHAAMAEAGRRRAAVEGPGVLIKYMLESKEVLEKSIKLLEHEPEDLPEGKIAKQAKINLESMETMIQNLFAMESQIQ